MLKQLRKSIASQERELPTTAVSSLMVLCQEGSPELKSAVMKLADKLGIDQEAVYYREFVTGLKPDQLQSDQWCKKHFGWQGKLQHEDAATFAQKDFDLIIGYYWEPNALLDNLIASKPHAFRVGPLGGHEELFDLTIATPKGDWAAFEFELIKYLTLLKLCR
ncbi:DUF6913 domain-containing protein [Gilvibacter sediminis]|uniref:DUF6913 domain-containing protein n=1 Tax=Gilvibacter sediminis TaxID=379071 RepID=UPI002350F6E6|nr:hypothetical protein [Gilvibacter sediminis]MDC7997841.1 hypothetical protein [Gilvibacter sediminis]